VSGGTAPDSAPATGHISGLSATAAAVRLKQDGFNELPVAGKRSFLRILFEVVRQPMFALLIGGGVVYLLLGDRLEALLLIVFACFSVIITIVQETRSENVLQALRNLASPRALVVRDGQRIQIAGREVVRDDLIVISEGDRVAADATLVSAQDLLLDESLLTGESVPVRKQAADAKRKAEKQPNARPGGEDLPYVFAGTLVVRGTGLALVNATGVRSEMGKIGHALKTIETEQPRLQTQIHVLVRNFAIFGILAGGLTVLLYGLLRGSWLEALLGGIAIGMSLLPEEFPLVLAVFMAMGAWRISQARVLTRRASAIETLGATTVLCTDKTGTLTENRMTIVAIRSEEARWDQEDNAPITDRLRETLAAALLACPREPSDPMDLAVHRLAEAQIGQNVAIFARHKLVRAYGLRPDLFAVVNVLVDDGDDKNGAAYAKGALEAIAELCKLPAEQRVTICEQADVLASKGIRVLGVAKASVVNAIGEKTLPDTPRGLDFVYVGLIGFADPIRSNVPAAVAECRSAGIRVVMITGDYPATALAIGKQAGIEATEVLSGDDLDGMPDYQLALHVKSASIFARIRPEQKLRIVQSLKANGEVVAMTGDGVNDAPAIKAAHIGIAMGGRGTDVAREASAIVLLDGDFGSIVKTIRLGRRIYDNLRKAIEFIVAVHIPIAGLAVLPLILGLPLILTPIHIAFLEMVIDPACSIVFEAEQEEDDVMRRPPRDPASTLLLPKRILWAVLQGLIVFAILAGVYIGAARMDLPDEDVRMLVFTSLILINVGLILVNRSFKSSLIGAFMRPNRALWILIGGIGALLATALLWPPAQSLFHFGRLHWNELGFAALAGVSSLFLLEAIKSQWFRTTIPHFHPKRHT
jgi:Ca2+-transporting ATPase